LRRVSVVLLEGGRADERRQGGPSMNWTKDPPKEPGWYWWRWTTGEGKPKVTKVFARSGRPQAMQERVSGKLRDE
jgi:hypothetical protein